MTIQKNMKVKKILLRKKLLKLEMINTITRKVKIEKIKMLLILRVKNKNQILKMKKRKHILKMKMKKKILKNKLQKK